MFYDTHYQSFNELKNFKGMMPLVSGDSALSQCSCVFRRPCCVLYLLEFWMGVFPIAGIHEQKSSAFIEKCSTDADKIIITIIKYCNTHWFSQ